MISYGRNGYGAVNTKGVSNDATSAGTDELTNISPVTAGTPPVVAVVKRETTDSTSGNGPFDDVIMVISANDLTGPLLANGTLQANAQDAIRQANDIVMGAVVASKSTCGDPSHQVCNSGGGYYYNIPDPTLITFPTSVTSWGITYVPTVTVLPITLSNPRRLSSSLDYPEALPSPPNPPNIAYTISSGDGVTSKTITFNELRGLLNRSPGFN